MSELLVLLWTARCLENHTVFLRLAQSPPCQPQLLRLLLPRMPDPVRDKLEQRKASAWDWPNSTGFHVITAKFFPAATHTAFPAEVSCASLPCSCPNPQLSLLEVWAGRVIWRCACPAVPPTQGRLQLFLAAVLPMEELCWGRRQGTTPFGHRSNLCFRSPHPEMGATPGCSLTCYNTAVTNSCKMLQWEKCRLLFISYSISYDRAYIFP